MVERLDATFGTAGRVDYIAIRSLVLMRRFAKNISSVARPEACAATAAPGGQWRSRGAQSRDWMKLAQLPAKQIGELSDRVPVRFPDPQLHADSLCFDLDEGRLSSVDPEIESVGISRGDRSIDRRTDTENRRLRRSR